MLAIQATRKAWVGRAWSKACLGKKYKPYLKKEGGGAFRCRWRLSTCRCSSWQMCERRHLQMIPAPSVSSLKWTGPYVIKLVLLFQLIPSPLHCSGQEPFLADFFHVIQYQTLSDLPPCYAVKQSTSPYHSSYEISLWVAPELRYGNPTMLYLIPGLPFLPWLQLSSHKLLLFPSQSFLHIATKVTF
jgi:hypothetical protein